MSESRFTERPEHIVDEYIKAENLTKTFNNGEVTAVDDINIPFGEGEFIVLLGPSGCGKTTTLRCIAGLEEPSEGEIYLDGNNITYNSPKDRNLAFVFQSIALFPHKTVRENIRFGLDMTTDLPKDEKDDKVENAAEMLGIGGLLDRQPDELSGGQQQRVSIGRAIVMDPAAFLLDEPFAALDANLRDQMETEVKEIQRDLNTTMIFVTHDQEEAMTLGDKIVIMNDGRIQQMGEAYDIYNDPQNEFVAQFIGSPSTNFFECVVVKENRGTRLEHDLFTVELDSESETAVEDGQMVRMGVRPEFVEIDEPSSLFSAEVTLIEPEGTNDVVHLQEEGVKFKSYPPQNEVSEIGKRVDVDISRDRIWLFDESGKRVL
jgi:multiple sugar transport system ATP-binding protein